MRHNIIYIYHAEGSEAKTERGRPESVGVEANWHLNPRPNAVSDSLFKRIHSSTPRIFSRFATRCFADTAWKESRSCMWRPRSAFRAPPSIRLKLDSGKAA